MTKQNVMLIIFIVFSVLKKSIALFLIYKKKKIKIQKLKINIFLLYQKDNGFNISLIKTAINTYIYVYTYVCTPTYMHVKRKTKLIV